MHFDTWYGKPLMRCNDFVARRVRSSPMITRLLFQVNVTERSRREYWDYTTLVLKKALSKYVRPNQRILEVGVGDYALLSIFLAKRFDVTVSGVDIVEEVVANAKKNVMTNGVMVDVSASDVLSNCEGKFDIIFWNLPYVPRAAQRGRKATANPSVAFDGGMDGVVALRRLVTEALPHLRDNGRLLVGVNSFYVTRTTVHDVIEQSSFRVEDIVTAWPNPSEVFVLRPRSADPGPTFLPHNDGPP
jgi:HemK-related putative methylase